MMENWIVRTDWGDYRITASCFGVALQLAYCEWKKDFTHPEENYAMFLEGVTSAAVNDVEEMKNEAN